MYILKVREPEIMVKDLAAALNVRTATARSIKRKVGSLRKDAFELRVLARLQPMVEENYTFIFNEHSLQKIA
jgi:cell division ATPase FtsA